MVPSSLNTPPFNFLSDKNLIRYLFRCFNGGDILNGITTALTSKVIFCDDLGLLAMMLYKYVALSLTRMNYDPPSSPTPPQIDMTPFFEKNPSFSCHVARLMFSSPVQYMRTIKLVKWRVEWAKFWKMLKFKVANSGCSVVFSADSGDNFRFSLSFNFWPCQPF